MTEAEQPDEEKAVPEQTEEQSQNTDTDASTGADSPFAVSYGISGDVRFSL